MPEDDRNINPGSIFLLLDKDLKILRAEDGNEGDDSFMRFLLDALEEIEPGAPIPRRLALRYDMGA